ncbi:putative ATP-dependent RNA helicase TDRD12 isoform X2 [Pecten maximus]|uniref:putative ATP-dependent RNA helicase TDRD12 isoform X2 n=1 Tax=Pecten maximus TaxID=6579 RepID=UPI00145902DC|nr:putative ATP-dependent RNA helicase TDRD12 isoform X2 [Pecten maximus]
MSLVDIEITKVKSPALFYAKVVKDLTESSNDLAFQQLEKYINDFFNSESLYLPSYIPNEGEICIGRRVSDRRWCRVEVKGVLSRRCGPEGRCYFLDYGVSDYIPLKWFRKASDDFLQVPFLVKKFCLYGVKPLTLHVETEDLTFKEVVTDTWDTAAVKLMNQVVTESQSTKARIRHVDQDNVHHVDLYFFSKKHNIWLNDEFVALNYATWFNPDEHQADSGEAVIQKLIKHTKTLERSLTADGRRRKHISGSCSDTEGGRIPFFSPVKHSLNTTVPVVGRMKRRGIHNSMADEITHSISDLLPQNSSGDGAGDDSPLKKNPKYTDQKRKPITLAEYKERRRLCDTAACSDSEMIYRSSPLQKKSTTRIQTLNSADIIKSSEIPMSPICYPSSQMSTDRQSTSPTSSTSSLSSLVVPKSAMLGKLLSALSPEKKESTTATKEMEPAEIDSTSKSTIKKLLHSDLGLPLTRARLPKSVMRSSTSESEPDSPRVQVSKQISTSSGKNSSSSSEDDKLVGDLKKSILKKPSTSVLLNEKPSVRFRDSEAIAETHAKKTQMLGRLTGKRLLDKLCIGGGTQSLGKKPVEMPNLNDDGVLVHSEDSLKPIYKIQDTPLDPIIREGLDNYGIEAPKFIQCYSWPALLRGRNIVGISPSESGKTFAYLAPLLTDLLKPTNYKDIPTGNGPYAIIMVPFWKSAQMVYDVTKTLLCGNNSFRVLVTYGGGNEESQVVPLINGCELLITTPRSLSRLLQQKYTHLERLCHIVIDDAEIVLEEFREEIQDLMINYARVVEEHVERSAPREVLVFSSRWCNMVNSFIDAFMPDPTLIITSRFEAAIYGRVKQIPLLWRTDQLMPQFLELVSSLARDNCKLIIFCSNVNTTLHIHKMLKSRSLYSLLSHDKMDTLMLEQIGGEWAGPIDKGKILICTDESVEELKLVDATAIIHYDLPSSKTKFGNRLSTMSKYYYNSSIKEKVGDIEPTSYILITEESGRQVETILQLLKRTKSKIPRNLHSMVMGINQQKNCDGEKELCVALKAYGSCRYQNKCTARHALVPDVDCKASQQAFNSGEVKVLVTHVVDASHYFVRVLEHKPPTGDKVDMSTTMLELTLKMAEWFGDLHNRSKYSNLCLGEMCAVSEDEETYHRVKVCDITGINSPGDRIKAEVKFVDDGRKSFVSLNKMYNLPPHLRDAPYQALEVFICRVQPVDLDENWTSKASMFVYDLLEQKTMDGRIVLRIGNTLWLDPLVERIYLNDLHAYCTNLYVRSELLKNGFAVDNPNHLQLLYDLCKGQIEVPKLNQHSDRSEKKTEVDILPESKEFHDVHLSAIMSPTLMYLQRSESSKLLEKMNDEINERMKNVEPTVMKLTSLKTGSVCLAKFGEDNMWYRVRILKELDDNMVKVLHVDFGDQEEVSRDNLQKIPQEFLELPFQAIEAGLSHIVPREERWEKSAEDLIWDLAHYVTSEMKVLTAKVVTKQQAMYSGIHKYFVELYDTSTYFDVNLALELVWSGYATPTEDSTYHDLFSPPQDKQFFTIPILKLLDLCSQIYWGKGDCKAVTASKEILKMVTSCAKSKPLNLVAYGGLKAIIKLIGRVGFEDIHRCLLDSLVTAASKHDRICEEIVEQDGGVGLVNSLEQTNRHWLQEQVLIAMEKFLDISIRFLPCFEEGRVVRTLCELLDSTEESKVQMATCRTLRKMCRLSEAVLLMTFDNKICSRLINCFEDGEKEVDPDVAMAAMELLDTLVEKNEKNEDSLTKPKLVKCVVNTLRQTEEEKFMLCGLRYCNYYGKLNRRNKTVLLQLELVPILDRLLSLPHLNSVIHDMCLEQKTSLVVNVQSSQTIKNTPISQSKASNDHIDSILPQVLWSENIFTVRLSIKVVGVNLKSDPVQITENSVTFRALVDGKVYSVEYILYDSILPARSQVKISSGEVTIVLRKNQKGRWPRLIKLKAKPANLLYDFDRYEDSSSAEDEDCDEDGAGPTRKSKKIRLPTGISAEKKQEIMERHRLEQSCSTQSSDENEGIIRNDDRDPYDIFDVGH